MNDIKTVLAIFGTIETLLFLGALIWAIALWVNGIGPALLRLGNGLAKRRIAIFANPGNLVSLRALLLDSKLFKQRNILEVTRVEDVGVAERATVYLVYWPDWSAHISEILKRKRDSCALIVYAPLDQGRIPENQMKDLDGHRHTAVTNFRGRLLNDIVTAMITTGYEKE